MAILIKEAKQNIGVEIKNGYYRIEKINFDATDDVVYFTGVLYASKEAREEGAQPVNEHYYDNNFVTADKTGDFIKQAYEFVKKQYTDGGEVEKELFGEMSDC